MWSILTLLFFLEVLILVNSQTCRVCDQFISGRNLPYERALTIIQDEEYLDDSDFDEIRYKRRYDSQSYNQGKMFRFFPLISNLIYYALMFCLSHFFAFLVFGILVTSVAWFFFTVFFRLAHLALHNVYKDYIVLL